MWSKGSRIPSLVCVPILSVQYHFTSLKMTTSKQFVTPIVLRATHVVLHIVTLIMICIGVVYMPNPKKKGKLLQAAQTRAVVWMCFEIFFCIVSSVMLICSIVNCTSKNPGPGILRIKTWFQENCPNFSFFYYVVFSLFVLYGTMIGCNIPLLFSKIQIYPFPYPQRSTQAWQVCLIDGVVVGVINTILYFIASFYPLNTSPTGDETEMGQDGQGQSTENKENAPELEGTTNNEVDEGD